MSAPRMLLYSVLFSGLACQTPSGAGVGSAGVPAELAPPAGAEPTLKLFARGTQNYQCAPGYDGPPQWKLVAPEAELRTTEGATASVTGTHGAGPSWTLTDGSGVIGDASQAKRASSKESGAVPWLLIPGKDNGLPGALQGVRFVQRIDTRGGAAPATGCDQATVGSEIKVPYTATYVFYRQH
jgi:Protein of unknown function (DUF3455)